MATGTAAQRKTYGGSQTVRSIWQRVETDAEIIVSADGYYTYADIATATIGDLVEIDGPDYSIMREIIGQGTDGSWNTGPWGGAGGGGSLSAAQLNDIAKIDRETPDAGGATTAGQVVLYEGRQWIRTDGLASTMPASLPATGWEEYSPPGGSTVYFDSTDNYVVQTGDLINLRPGHTLDLTGLTTGQWFEDRISDDHTGNPAAFEVGAFALTGDSNTGFGLGDSRTEKLADGNFRRVAGGTTTVTTGVVSTLDLAALITN